MEWNPDYLYRIRGTWAKRGQDEIIVFNLVNATPAVLITQDTADNPVKRRVFMLLDEWTDDFGDEFYEHTLENGFFYLTPDADWHAQAESVPAPGIAQIRTPTAEDLQLSIELLRREVSGNE